jgi:hypothetical protein
VKKSLVYLLIGSFCVATQVFAADKKTAKNEEAPAPKHHKEALVDQVSGAGYGIAGCGLGSIVFGAKPGKVQIFASTTNGLYGNNTFGITSGTSNCDIPQMGQQAAVYIEVNKEIVKKEAARGQGDTLVGLSHILNCSNEALFSQKVQQNYGQIFGDDQSSYGSTREILNTIKNNQDLAATCNTQG